MGKGEPSITIFPAFHNKSRSFQKLHLIADGSEAQKLAVLKDDWANTDVRINDVVNLIGSWEAAGKGATPTMVLSTSRNILILHPDLLIPTTAISTASKCLRRPLLSSLVRSSSADITPSTVWGHMLHEVMQSCLSSGTWRESFISERIDEQIRSGFDRLIQIKVGFDDARSELLERAKGLVTFGSLYVSPVPIVRQAQNTASLYRTESICIGRCPADRRFLQAVSTNNIRPERCRRNYMVSFLWHEGGC